MIYLPIYFAILSESVEAKSWQIKPLRNWKTNLGVFTLWTYLCSNYLNRNILTTSNTSYLEPNNNNNTGYLDMLNHGALEYNEMVQVVSCCVWQHFTHVWLLSWLLYTKELHIEILNPPALFTHDISWSDNLTGGWVGR